MPSAWVQKRTTAKGKRRWYVVYRLGGRETALRYAGSFKTEREAKVRRDVVGGELAALRVPNVRILERSTTLRTLSAVAEQWRSSRVDVSEGTAATHRVNLGRIVPRLGERPVESIEPADVATLVTELAAEGLARESIRKTRATLAMVLDFAGVQPNPARDKGVKLPREDRAEIQPPTAAHLLAVLPLLPPRYRLPVLVLDGTGMRVGELEQLAWGDYPTILEKCSDSIGSGIAFTAEGDRRDAPWLLAIGQVSGSTAADSPFKQTRLARRSGRLRERSR